MINQYPILSAALASMVLVIAAIAIAFVSSLIVTFKRRIIKPMPAEKVWHDEDV